MPTWAGQSPGAANRGACHTQGSAIGFDQRGRQCVLQRGAKVTVRKRLFCDRCLPIRAVHPEHIPELHMAKRGSHFKIVKAWD